MRKSKNNKKRKIVLRWLVAAFAFVFAVLLFVAVVSSYIAPDAWWYVLVFQLAFPLLWILNFIFLIWGLVSWRRYVWVPLIAFVFSWGVFHRHFQWLNGAAEVSQNKHLSVLSFNVRSFKGLGAENQYADKDSVMVYLSQHPSSVVCLQEFVTYNKLNTIEQFQDSLNKPYNVAFNYRYIPRNRSYTDLLVVFSEYPIVDKKPFYQSKKLYAVRADIDIDSVTYSVYNVHLASNHFVERDFELFADASVTNKSDGAKTLLYKLRANSQARARQVRTLAQDIADNPNPSIICGDFNDVPASFTYRTLAKGMSDAFREQGCGYGNTYNGPLPPIRIDYMLFDENAFQILDYKMDKVNMSDHYPLRTVFSYE